MLQGGWCTCRLVIAANGVAYLPHAARPGIVPRLLQEILSTRIMVKGAMKSTPASHKVLQVHNISACPAPCCLPLQAVEVSLGGCLLSA